MSLLFELNRGDLISPAHEQAQRDACHVDTGGKWAQAIATLVREQRATSVLDYGAGHGTLAIALKQLVPQWTRITQYDPAVDRISDIPSFADIVVVTNVLEHVEGAKLATVLAHLKMLSRKAVFVVVDTPNAAWWIDLFAFSGFDVGTSEASTTELVAVLT